MSTLETLLNTGKVVVLTATILGSGCATNNIRTGPIESRDNNFIYQQAGGVSNYTVSIEDAKEFWLDLADSRWATTLQVSNKYFGLTDKDEKFDLLKKDLSGFNPMQLRAFKTQYQTELAKKEREGYFISASQKDRVAYFVDAAVLCALAGCYDNSGPLGKSAGSKTTGSGSTTRTGGSLVN